MRTIFILLLFFGLFTVKAQSATGLWKTIDDETGKPRSIVQIEERNGQIFGSIVRLFRSPDEEQDPICKVCPGQRKNQKIIGMEIINGLRYDQDDEEYSGGEILDPESGNVYDCKIWLSEEGTLKVRGYVMFLFRTQTWLPYAE
ncbi:MAG: DUF2147 domain-containing protein [Marinoscillum sp.]|uniref:DUF2147 domain-containing protein n=1 Tax=Marinoscillum sp. TaxID=2024838 RepID=UPI0032F9E882